MRSNSGRLKNWKLYVILDKASASDRRLLKIARCALSGGADVIQLRDKNVLSERSIRFAKKIRAMCRRFRVPFIVDDRIELAVAANADGLHLGPSDLDMRVARRILGNRRILGISARSLASARSAKNNGADYLGVGPVYKTPMKDIRPIGINRVTAIKRLGVPVIAIGGINKGTVAPLIGRGIRSIAVIRAVSEAKNPLAATKELKEALCA